MTQHTTPTSFLAASDPNYPQFVRATQFERDPRVRQMAAVIISNCPYSIRGDSALCAEYIAGPATASVIQAALAAGEHEAIPHLARAEGAKDRLIVINRDLEVLNSDRAKIPSTPVDGPHGRRVTPAENRAQLAKTQQVVSDLMAGEQDEHTKEPHTPLSGHVAAILAAIIESTFTLRLFNVSLSHISLSNFLPWLAVTIMFALFNVKVAEWLGGRRRSAREIQSAAAKLNARGLVQAHARGVR